MKARLALYALTLVNIGSYAYASEADSANSLTHGMAQMTLRVGQTTQLEVLEAFGAPNITTLDAVGNEVWVYDRHATISKESSGGFKIGLDVGGIIGGISDSAQLGYKKSKSKSESSSRTMTIIIKFDSNKIIYDFRSRSSSF